MIGLEIRMLIQSDKRHEFLQAFDMFSQNQKTTDDCAVPCLERSMFECIGTPNRFLWLEKWMNAQSLDDYMNSDRFKALLGAIRVLGKLESIHKGDQLRVNDAK